MDSFRPPKLSDLAHHPDVEFWKGSPTIVLAPLGIRIFKENVSQQICGISQA
jgi:hypothetical protein